MKPSKIEYTYLFDEAPFLEKLGWAPNKVSLKNIKKKLSPVGELHKRKIEIIIELKGNEDGVRG